MRPVLLTIASGAHEACLALSGPGFAAYAQRHGYEVVVAEPWPGLSPVWSKLPRAIEWLQTGRDVLWIDADCVILDRAADLRDDIAPSSFQALAHDSRIGATICLWYLRAEPRSLAFLDAALALRDEVDDVAEAEQYAVRRLLGMTGAAADPQWAEGTTVLPPRWGDLEGDAEDPWLIHCGSQGGPISMPDRLAWMRRALPLTSADILGDTLAVIEDPERWVCRHPSGGRLPDGGALALRDDGAATHWADPRAVGWCLGGAMALACGHQPLPGAASDGYQGEGCPHVEAHGHAVRLLRQLTGLHYDMLNERMAHEEIVGAVREALMRARAPADGT